MTKKQTWILTLLSLVCLVLALLISGRLWFRLDLTKNKAYTISPVSRSLYREIPDQVAITYFVSDKLFSIHPLPGEIEDLLREYSVNSRGKIRYTRRDPVKANLTDAVEQLGIQYRQIQSIEQNEAVFTNVYTGILIEYLDRAEVLPWVLSLDTLEYDLTSRIRALVRDSDRELGVLLADADKQWESDFRYLDQMLTMSGYRLRLLSAGEEIGDTLPVLFVLGGVEELDEWALYRIDRYIRQGGKVLFALEGVFVNAKGSLECRVKEDKGLLAMLASYGVSVEGALVLDRSALTLQYETAGPRGQRQIRLARYPHWIGVLGENGNPAHPLTAGFGGVDLFWASPLTLSPPEGVEGLPLFSSTPEAWLMTRDFNLNPDAEYLFEQEAPDTRGAKVLAAALWGKFPSWFQDRPKPVREGSEEELPDMSGEAAESRIVVIGDADMGSGFARDQRNLDFLIKTADWLGNDDDIIAIRNRQSQSGRLDRIQDPEKRLKTIGFAQFLNVAFIPLAVILAGVFRCGRRRGAGKEKERSHGV
jgi:ABC-type uncharacterized transport system involved in gliding motility auxiliary subunit